jgi:DNA-binding NtrC family response regulator
VRNGNFRADLFFRLRSINIRIPPLRDRKEDVPLFVEEFARQVCEKNKMTFGGITDDGLALLQSYHWPGNVRELRNVVESMLVVERGRRIDAKTIRKYLNEFHDKGNGRNLPVHTRKTPEQVERELIYRALLDVKNDIMELKEILRQVPVTREVVPVGHQFEDATVSSTEQNGTQIVSLDKLEKRSIIEALGKFKGNRRLASKALNISERTLYRKIKEYNLNL